MHFDERLDSAVSTGTFGSRHRFVEAERADSYIDDTLRLVEIDTLVIHYRTRDGASSSSDLRVLRTEILKLCEATDRSDLP